MLGPTGKERIIMALEGVKDKALDVMSPMGLTGNLAKAVVQLGLLGGGLYAAQHFKFNKMYVLLGGLGAMAFDRQVGVYDAKRRAAAAAGDPAVLAELNAAKAETNGLQGDTLALQIAGLKDKVTLLEQAKASAGDPAVLAELAELNAAKAEINGLQGDTLALQIAGLKDKVALLEQAKALAGNGGVDDVGSFVEEIDQLNQELGSYRAGIATEAELNARLVAAEASLADDRVGDAAKLTKDEKDAARQALLVADSTNSAALLNKIFAIEKELKKDDDISAKNARELFV
jgi:hypothetical protein